MKLETQVVSLELAKRLKELGVKQESQFNWCQGRKDKKWVLGLLDRPLNKSSAFTVAELGEMLRGSSAGDVTPSGVDSTWQWQTVGTQKHPAGQVGYEATEADARAKMLIYLLENKLMAVPDHDCHASREDGCAVCGRREV